jgi:TolB protein
MAALRRLAVGIMIACLGVVLLASGVGRLLARGGEIALSSYLGGNNIDIFLIDVATALRVNLTRHNANDCCPAWSPDGTQIAFVSTRSGRRDIYVMNLYDGHLRRLTRDNVNNAEPVWSPDGAQIAFVSYGMGYNQIRLVEAACDVEHCTRPAQTLTAQGENNFAPHWSPDGRHLLYETTRRFDFDIYAICPTPAPDCSAHEYRLTPFTTHDRSPVWSPDGDRIAYTNDRDRDRNFEIYTMNTFGRDEQRLTEDNADDNAPAWSPDGSQLVFVSNRGRNYEVYVMSAQCAPAVYRCLNPKRQLTHTHLDHLRVAWSPDGSQLAALAVQDNGRDLYVMNADGSSYRKLPGTYSRLAPGAHSFAWRP